jgi:DNA-binding response OmpR family regulator
VVSKVRAVLRRTGAAALPKAVRRIADLIIDLDAHEVRRDKERIDLTPTEFSLLVTLSEQPGRAFSRFQLLEASQGTTYEGYERTIDAHIKNLRAKLEPDTKNPRYIETVFGVGYRFARE